MSIQHIKVGSISEIIDLSSNSGEHADSHPFILSKNCVWGEQGAEISIEKLRQNIEPWLTALFQSEHLNLLIGAGLSSAIQKSATGLSPVGMGWINDLKVCKSEIDEFST
ncbi:hypothetical protein EWN49_003596, partial [Escherichia coli]|nr:hypothetical protein [Escherichia coli]